MPSSNQNQAGHTENDPSTEALINALGPRFGDLVIWAAERDLLFHLEIGYRILGLDPNTIAIANLFYELNRPESKAVISQWTDSDLLQGLHRFADSFYADKTISGKYPRITPAGNYKKVRAQFQPYADQKFLLALITFLLHGQPGTDVYSDRRRIRLWLLIQAAKRLIAHGCAGDKFISAVARFLVRDPIDKDWLVVDTLLRTTRENLGQDLGLGSFERYTQELGRVAESLKHDSRFAGRSYTLFLNAVTSVATGECSPTEVSETAQPLRRILTLGRQRNDAPQTEEVLSAEPDFPLALFDEDEPEGSFYALTQVDPTDSPEQQLQGSGSIYLLTAEHLHYLPWTWDRVLPPEAQLLEAWIGKLLQSKDLIEKTGATFVWVATRLARSLALTERIGISEGLSSEWSFTPDFKMLKRNAPRRQSSWRGAEPVAELLAPYRDDLTVNVPQEITSALLEASRTHPGPETLQEIWRVVCNEKLEAWFNAQARVHFPRITSAKLALYQSQRLFNGDGQPQFERLLASHPQTAVPAACSYTAWDIPSVEKGLRLSVQKHPGALEQTHIMGSLLCPKEEALAAEIERGKLKMDQAHSKDLIQYHNAVAQHVVTALYAATGGRPLQDPFESASYFSEFFQCVYIADKSDDGLHTGRVVPLPSRALKLFGYYLQFLEKLAAELHMHKPELAFEIRMAAQGRPAKLPLFFLLDHSLQWHSMSQASRLGCSLFDFKLPRNLFRHRYAQRLLSNGVDPEVIDGWMGHAERGAASYGDYSIRCWADDAATFKPAYESAYDSLPFTSSLQLEKLPPLLCTPGNESIQVKPRLFGLKALEKQRELKAETAKKDAAAAIKLSLGERSLADLSDAELKTLSDRMLLRDDGLKHAYAALRFNVLLDQLRELGTEGVSPESIRYQLLSKRLLKFSNEHSLIQPDCIKALETYIVLLKWSEHTKKNTFKASLSKSHALSIGAILLAIEKRLCYEGMLWDICQGQNFRILQENKAYYLEYNENLDPENFYVPAQRHRISYKTASLLAHGLHDAKKVTMPKLEAIKGIQLVVDLQSKYGRSSDKVKSVEELVSWLCEVINQANLLELPGIVTATLSGRTLATSLPLHDWMRVQSNKVLALDSKKQAKSPELNPVVTRATERTCKKLELQESAKRFGSEIDEILKSYEKTNAKKCALEIVKVAKSYRFKVSSSLLLVASWIAYKAETGLGRGRKFQPYAKNTLQTYWSSIFTAFRGHLYEVDLVALDSDEVTEYCSSILEYKWLQGQDASYLGERMIEFFRWASNSGVATPAWSELNLECKDRSVRPGFITEFEYQACQEQIQQHPEVTKEQKLILGFILLLTYRFGLRLQEAAGLLRRDWCDESDTIYVLVQPNQYRALKSRASRRAVPLAFELTEQEREIIQRSLLHYKSYAGEDDSKSLFCESINDDERRPILSVETVSLVSPTLIQLIRHVTGNPSLVLHHARHSFYNRIAPALLGFDTELSSKICKKEEYAAIRRIVLGPVNSHTRRGGMALARLMGHAFVSTGLKSYFHLATEWADSLTPVTHQRAREIEKAVKIENFFTVPLKHDEVGKLYTPPTPSLKDIFKVLRLVALGVSYERAEDSFELNPRYTKILEENINSATATVRFKAEKGSSKKLKGHDYPNALLESVASTAWLRFIAAADKIDNKQTSHASVHDNLQDINFKSSADGFASEAKQFKNLHEIPHLIGMDRHILMEQKEHVDFVKLVLERFEVAEDRYRVLIKPRSVRAIKHLQTSGFKLEIDTSNQLDTFIMYMPQRESFYKVDDYGGLILKQSSTGVIRDRIDLSLALLAYGSYLQMVQMERVSQV